MTAVEGNQSAAGPEADEYQSLYRRYRPGRFAEVLGQEHVTRALLNAVASNRVGHAYLFSGPRGTGKTSSARILAKALNCASPERGEPCGHCDSCIAVSRGSSLDVHELDAASNNGVEAMRDLVARASLASPGRWKIYIIDEVHMLSTAASNALLKTLEEPPPSVVFVLATTDQQKVLPTIRSRTQHYEFHLLGPDVLDGLVARVAKDADLDVSPDVMSSVVRRARGSARDALSVLDQAVAAGMVDDAGPLIDELVTAIVDRDAQAALVALDRAVAAGRDPQVLAAELVERMRQVFLAAFAPDLASPAGGTSQVGAPPKIGLAALVRSMETVGRAQVEMRSSVDPRVSLEVALVRLAHPEVDVSPEAMLERIERIERGGGAHRGQATPPPGPREGPRGSGAVSQGGEPALGRSLPSRAPAGSPSEAGSASRNLRERYGKASAPAPTGGASRNLRERYGKASAQSPRADPVELSASGTGRSSDEVMEGTEALQTRESPGSGALPGRDELTKAWGDGLLASLPTKVRARYKVGRFVDGEVGTATFALPNEVHRGYCEELRREVQAALCEHFGASLELVLVVDPEAARLAGVLGTPASGAPSAPPRERRGPDMAYEEEILSDPSSLLNEAEVQVRASRLMEENFPGAVELSSGKGSNAAPVVVQDERS